MRYCIFSDVHGNLSNLLDFFSCTSELGVDEYICLGDLCNYYPDNKAVIELVISKDIKCILGNHDEFYTKPESLPVERKQAYNFQEELLTSDYHVNYLRSLPRSISVSGDSQVLFCHGSPHDLTNEYLYPDSDLTRFKELKYDYVFCGHTHRQFVRNSGNIIFCNVGSVGMPRDNGSLFGFAIFDEGNQEIQLYRKTIDIDEIVTKYAGKVPDEVIRLLDRREKLEFKYTLIND